MIKITKAGLVLLRDTKGVKELMLVKANNKDYAVMPGGKQDSGEEIEATLQRELTEELGTTAVDVKYLGKVSGHTPDGREIDEHLFTGRLRDEPSPHAEIEQIFWCSKKAMQEEKRSLMTPLALEAIIPFLEEKQLF
jgi:8-oxo-dGTP diphosphatase